MIVDVRALAIRFADLWAVDPHQMADEIYSPRVTMENMANPARCITSGAELHVIEDRLAALIPEHRHELIRVVVAGRTACLETTVVAPLSHEYAPACLWWWIDDAGQVAAEVGWFDWDRRVDDSYLSHGTVPRSHAGGAGQVADPRRRAEQYARVWSTDPLERGLAMFSPQCTTGHVSGVERRGLDQLSADRTREMKELPLPGRRMEVQCVIGEGPCLAMLVLVGHDVRATRGTIVLTFDSDGKIISERRYLDWKKALARREFDRRQLVGSPGWSLA